MKKHSKLLLVLLLFISIGFAYLTVNVDIAGTIAFKENVWGIHMEDIVVNEESVDAETPIINDGEISFNLSMNRPGDIYEFYVDVVNEGTMDAILDSFTTTSLTGDYLTYLDYSVSYYSNKEIKKGDILRAGLKEKIKVRVSYKYDVDEYVQLNNINLTLSIGYVKIDNQATKYNKNIWNFDSKSEEDIFTVPKTGTYRLETWGAQGGYAHTDYISQYYGGYGAYATGELTLTEGTKLYISVGEEGKSQCIRYKCTGGYNGGGDSGPHDYDYHYMASGGGATHIATSTGLLKTLSAQTSNIIIVSSGGGGSFYRTGGQDGLVGGAGGGYTGTPCTKNSTNQDIAHITCQEQTEENTEFGLGKSNMLNGSGGGYRGGTLYGGGGSSYIGYSSLQNKVIYCYGCTASEETETKTIATTKVSETPTSNYAKIGQGYARITYVD